MKHADLKVLFAAVTGSSLALAMAVAPVAAASSSPVKTQQLSTQVQMMPPDEMPPTGVLRYAGKDRYRTSESVRGVFYEAAERIVVASGANFPDALVGAAIAGKELSPMVITDPNRWRCDGCANGMSNVIIMGGESVISKAVENQLRAVTKPGSIKRYAGKNRFDTAAKAMRATYPGTQDTVIIANGTNFPDALAASAPAGFHEYPMLLSQSDRLPSETAGALAQFKPSLVYLIGGKSVLSESLETQIRNAAGQGVNIERIAGPDRFVTAERVAYEFYTPQRPQIVIANGTQFPDALVGSALATRYYSPILLTQKNVLPNPTRKALINLQPGSIGIVGGVGVVSQKVATDLDLYDVDPYSW